MSIDASVQRYAFLTLLAAALFGASTPVAKQLVGNLSPVLLAGLLYLGSGVGLSLLWVGRRRDTRGPLPSGPQWAWLLGAVASGGIAAPLLLVHGLRDTPAGAAALLLNLESVLTALVARFAFREAVGRRVWGAAAIMLVAASLLAWDPRAAFGLSGPALLIVGACLLWAVDNNLTRHVSTADPVFLAGFKGLVAGACNVGLGLALGSRTGGAGTVAAAMLVGLLGYGISLVLFILGLRHLGSARAGAHFATAPFFGSAVAIVIFGEPLTAPFALAVGLMALATWLVLSESHEHEHTHEPLFHEHEHVHDDHHQHAHAGDEGPEPHSHPHRHEPLRHSHPHLPDVHHRHEH